MAKTIKKQAKAKPITLAQLKKEVNTNLKKKSKTEKFALKLVRSNFNETLSSPSGFGAQDLKEPYFSIYTHLLLKYKQDLVVKLISLSDMTIELWVKV